METLLGDAWVVASTEGARQMGRITRTGSWMTVLPSTINGTELGVQEWRYFLFLCYSINTPTYRTIAMDVAHHLTYSTPLTAKSEAS